MEPFESRDWTPEFRRAYDAHQKHLAGEDGGERLVDLCGIDIPHNLEGCVFDRADLSGELFSGKRLDGASFIGAVLNFCDFSGATMARAVFSGTPMGQTRFSGAILSFAIFDSARLSSVHFDGADLSGASFANASLGELCDFTRANITELKVANATVDSTMETAGTYIMADGCKISVDFIHQMSLNGAVVGRSRKSNQLNQAVAAFAPV